MIMMKMEQWIQKVITEIMSSDEIDEAIKLKAF